MQCNNCGAPSSDLTQKQCLFCGSAFAKEKALDLKDGKGELLIGNGNTFSNMKNFQFIGNNNKLVNVHNYTVIGNGNTFHHCLNITAVGNNNQPIGIPQYTDTVVEKSTVEKPTVSSKKKAEYSLTPFKTITIIVAIIFLYIIVQHLS